MNQEEIRKLAIECGAEVKTGTWFCGSPIEVRFFTLSETQLAAYTAAVEAPLQAELEHYRSIAESGGATIAVSQLEIAQARIAQLEEALKHANKQPYPFGHLELFEKALAGSSTWLSVHPPQEILK